METPTSSAPDLLPWLRSFSKSHPDRQLVASVLDVNRRLFAFGEALRLEAEYESVAEKSDSVESAGMERVRELLDESGCHWVLSAKLLSLSSYNSICCSITPQRSGCWK